MPWATLNVAIESPLADVKGEKLLTGWNSDLTVENVTIPNWTLAIAALMIAALAVLHATTKYPTRRFIVLLAGYGTIHAAIASKILASAAGHLGVGAPLTLVAYGAIFAVNLIPTIARTAAAIAGKRAPSVYQMARGSAVVAFAGNFATVRRLPYHSRHCRRAAFPIGACVLMAILIGFVVAAVAFLAVVFFKTFQSWATPMVEAISSKPQTTGEAVRATMRIGLIASACGWIGLAAIVAGFIQLHEHTSVGVVQAVRDLFFALILAFPINLLLAPIVYLAIRSKKASRIVSAASRTGEEIRPGEECAGGAAGEAMQTSAASVRPSGVPEAMSALQRGSQNLRVLLAALLVIAGAATIWWLGFVLRGAPWRAPRGILGGHWQGFFGVRF